MNLLNTNLNQNPHDILYFMLEIRRDHILEDALNKIVNSSN